MIQAVVRLFVSDKIALLIDSGKHVILTVTRLRFELLPSDPDPQRLSELSSTNIHQLLQKFFPH